FISTAVHTSLHTFPTRRSSDLHILTPHKVLKHGKLITDGSNSHAFYADIDFNGTVVRLINIYLQPFQLQKSMVRPTSDASVNQRSEEHTSELQSRENLVCRLLL